MDKIEHWFKANYERLVENTNKITRDKERTYDVLQECVLSFLQQPKEKEQKIYDHNQIEHFITRCVNIQYKSSTSPYHRKHRKQQQTEVMYLEWQHLDIPIDVNEEENVCEECIMRELNNLHFYYRTLIQDKYLKGMTYAELHRYYGISKNSLLKDVKIGLEILKQKCK